MDKKIYIELNDLRNFCKKYTEHDAVQLILNYRTDLIPTVSVISAIPIDRIKQLMEEIEKTESVEPNGSVGFKTGFHGGYDYKRLDDLALIDNIIKEYEGENNKSQDTDLDLDR